MSTSRSAQDFAMRHGIELVFIPQSDACELSLSYIIAVNFVDYLNKRSDVLSLKQISDEPIRILGPTFKDLGIDSSFFKVKRYIGQDYPYASPESKRNIKKYVRRKIWEIRDNHLAEYNGGKFRGNYFDTEWGFGPERLVATYPYLPTSITDFTKLAEKPAELKEIADALTESIRLIEQYFSTSNTSLASDISEIIKFKKNREDTKQRADIIELEKLRKEVEGWTSKQGLFALNQPAQQNVVAQNSLRK